MPVNYLSYTLKAHDVLNRLGYILDLLDGASTREWRKTAAELNDKLESLRFQVAVVGEFKRGKTSFINALLRQEILPADVAPATATLNRVTYGSTASAYICWKDGRPDEQVEIGELSRYITKLTEEYSSNAERIREAVVCFPCLFCQNNVDLIDTPGMNDDEEMNSVTIGELANIDLAIVTLDPNYPVSSTESDFIARLVESDQICQIIFVASKIDTVPASQREELLKTVAERISTLPREVLLNQYGEDDPVIRKFDRLLANPIIYPVSAMQALEAYRIGKQELLEKSGFQRLTDELAPLIIAAQHSAAVLTPLSATISICRRISRLCEATIRVNELSQSREALRRRFADTAYGSWVDNASIMDACGGKIDALRRERVQQAFGQIKRAYLAGGNTAAVAAARNAFQGLEAELPGEEESLYRSLWEEHFLTGYGVLSGALEEILAASGSILRGETPDLSPLTLPYERLPFRFTDRTAFSWNTAPAPPDGTPSGQRDYFILSRLESILGRYYDQRLERAFLLVERMSAYEAGLCQEIVRGYFRATPPVETGDVFQNLPVSKARFIAREADDLAKDCALLRDDYLAHTG